MTDLFSSPRQKVFTGRYELNVLYVVQSWKSMKTRRASQKPGFNPGAVHMKSAVKERGIVRGYSPNTVNFPCQYHSTSVSNLASF